MFCFNDPLIFFSLQDWVYTKRREMQVTPSNRFHYRFEKKKIAMSNNCVHIPGDCARFVSRTICCSHQVKGKLLVIINYAITISAVLNSLAINLQLLEMTLNIKNNHQAIMVKRAVLKKICSKSPDLTFGQFGLAFSSTGPDWQPKIL